MTWFDDDICWCGNECGLLACERNIKNRKPRPGIYTMALLRNTELCLLSTNRKDNKCETEQ